MAQQQDAWWSYSRERYERLQRTKAVEAYGTVDLCGLPMLRAKPCKPGSKNARWFLWCPCCQWQALTRSSGDAYALFGWGETLRALGHDERALTVRRIKEQGRAYLDQVSWASVQLGGREKLISTGPLLGCLHCGERASVELRQDKWGRPMPRCNACKVQVFPRIAHSQVLTVGMALAMREGAIDWPTCWDKGQDLWAGWRALAAGGHAAEQEMTSDQVSTREVGSGRR